MEGITMSAITPNININGNPLLKQRQADWVWQF